MLWWLLPILIISVFIFIFIWWKRQLSIKIPFHKVSTKTEYKVLDYSKVTDFDNAHPFYSMQPYPWQYEMRKYGEKLNKKGIEQIFFAHGTFAGNDPFDMIHLISDLMKLDEGKKAIFKTFLKKKQDSFFADLGNFDDKYIELVKEGLNHNIKVSNFVWSSGNNHYSRLKASWNLIEYIAHRIENHSKKRLLLIGHSHAGQLFALMTLMLGNKKILNQFFKITNLDIQRQREIKKGLKKIKSHPINFVTMGMPPRYPWILKDNMKLLNFINHRGREPIAGNPSGFFTTKDGDYIQQWGIEGSDIRSPRSSDQAINIALEQILGIGFDAKIWLDKMQQRKRVPDFGKTLLVDYKDNSRFPNAWKTLFGHGIYTRYEPILFHFKKILEEL